MLGLRCFAGFSLGVVSGGHSPVGVCWLLTAMAPLVSKHSFNSWGTQAWRLHTRDLPGPGTEPLSPALAGRFFPTEPSGKPLLVL